MARTGEDTWRVTADWCSRLTADFTAYLTDAEGVDFAEEMLSRLGAASGASFSAAVTPGRNNPLVLKAEPVEDGFAFFVRLTPNGDDGACHLQMEFDPIPIEDLREAFHALHAALVVRRLVLFTNPDSRCTALRKTARRCRSRCSENGRHPVPSRRGL